MKVIGIGGSGSGAGKTHAACAVIRAMASRGLTAAAVKLTPDPLYTSITDDPDVIAEPGKDTALMKEAGAAEVLWVRAQGSEVLEALEIALGRLSAHDAVIVEGNSAIEVLKTDIVLFIDGKRLPGEPRKESAASVLSLADVVIHDGELPPGTPGNARTFTRSEAGECAAHVVSLINKGA